MLKTIKLQDFRNFKNKNISFSPEITVIIGPNASGKTNILESIFLLSTGKSFHARIEEEMISYNSDLARIVGEVGSNLPAQVGNQELEEGIRDSRFPIPNSKLEVVLTRGEIEVGEEKYEKVPRKRLLVNGISRRLIDFAGKLKVVLFGPWDLDLVTESPFLRRKFLDTVLSQVDREYRRAVLSYEKGLRQRNKLLWKMREDLPAQAGSLSRSQLLFWDRLLIKNGDYISSKREEIIRYANSMPGLNEQIFQLEYDKSAISEGRLEQYSQEEVAAATTLVGPHRDDFIFKVKGKRQEIKDRELARFGSRGEQRMSILWLKLAELAYIEKKTAEKPTLLLDDIFSELDYEHQKIVVGIVKKGGQTIITTTDLHYIEGFKKVEKLN